MLSSVNGSKAFTCCALQDTYTMVGLAAFNDDATETKGISLFSINVLAALPANNTDDEVDVVRSLVAHEYFHNWSGRDSS